MRPLHLHFPQKQIFIFVFIVIFSIAIVGCNNTNNRLTQMEESMTKVESFFSKVEKRDYPTKEDLKKEMNEYAAALKIIVDNESEFSKEYRWNSGKQMNKQQSFRESMLMDRISSLDKRANQLIARVLYEIQYNMIIQDTSDAWAYYQRGISRFDRKDFVGALLDFEKVIKLNPNFAKTYYQRGRTYWMLRKDDAAFDNYNVALKIDSTLAECYLSRGNIYYDRGDKTNAFDDFDRVIKFGQRGSREVLSYGYYNRGLCYARGRNKDKDKARADFIKAKELGASDAEDMIYKYCDGPDTWRY